MTASDPPETEEASVSYSGPDKSWLGEWSDTLDRLSAERRHREEAEVASMEAHLPDFLASLRTLSDSELLDHLLDRAHGGNYLDLRRRRVILRLTRMRVRREILRRMGPCRRRHVGLPK